MERLRERLNLAAKALETFGESATLQVDPVAKRDTSIMRFIYTFEAVWKAAQRFLLIVEGVDVRVPKGCVRASRDARLLTDEQTVAALTMADDRNLSVHVYNEALAIEIYSRVPRHLATMQTWLEAMNKRV